MTSYTVSGSDAAAAAAHRKRAQARATRGTECCTVINSTVRVPATLRTCCAPCGFTHAHTCSVLQLRHCLAMGVDFPAPIVSAVKRTGLWLCLEEILLLDGIEDILGCSLMDPIAPASDTPTGSGPRPRKALRFGGDEDLPTAAPTTEAQASPPNAAQRAHIEYIQCIYTLCVMMARMPSLVGMLDASPEHSQSLEGLLVDQFDALGSYIAFDAATDPDPASACCADAAGAWLQLNMCCAPP